jgi:vancomycin resistance protein YoaR
MQHSDTADPPKVRAAHAATSQEERLKGTTRMAKAPLRGGLVALAGLVVALVALLVVYGAAHDGRVFRGVSVLGSNVGGLNRAEAKAVLEQATAGYPSEALSTTGAGKSWSFSAAELGVAVDVERTLDAAFGYGRGEGFLDNISSQLGGLFGSTPIVPVLKQEAARLDSAVARIVADADKPAVDSKLEIGPDGKVFITPSSSGTVVDRDGLRASIAASVASVPFSPVSVTMRDQAPKVTEDALRASEAQALLLTEQPISLKSGEQVWKLEAADLRKMLSITPAASGGEWTAALNAEALAAYLKPVADELHRAPVDANIAIGKGTVTLNEDEAGADLDVPAAAAAIQQAAAKGDAAARAVELPVKEVPAAVHTEQLQALYNKANSLVTEGMRVKFRDDGYILRGASVTGFIDVAPAQGGPGPLKLVIDEEVLADRIAGVGYYINRPATDARFRMVDGTPTKVTSGREGFKINIDNSVQNALKAIEGYQGGDRLQVDLDVAVTEPSLKDADISNINTPDLLTRGQTSYAGSSAERAWNVELGTKRMNGALVPPGGVFSTNDTIGDLTLEAGFKMGYGIITTSKGVTTVPSEAGGICQVSTTLFHAVFRGGLQIVERNWHSYWIGTYGAPPTGLQGLDATIAPPEKDFRFKNNTGNWLLVNATADGKNVVFELYGVNPGWKVAIGQPIITNVVKTDYTPVTEYSSELPKGKRVLVERPQNGFNSTISRTVTDANGNVIDTWAAKSRYVPSRERYLVGR